jgi:putative flippase GtrA
VPYVRARGEALGVPLRGGQLQRLERVLVLGIAVAFSPIADAALAGAGDPPRHWLAVGGIVFVAVGSNVTAITRLLDLLRRLTGALPQAAARPLSSLVGLDLLGSGLATAADFGLALLLHEGQGVPAALATALGAGAGGLLHFGFSRVVTYRSGRPGLPQLGRYLLVSASGLLLNVGGIALLLLHAELRYAWAWWLVRAAVYVLWSFPLQRSWVFGDARPSEGLTHAQ